MIGSYYPGLPYGGQSEGTSYGVDLVVQDMLHGHSIDNIVLTQQHSLVVADMLHGHSLDGNLVLVEAKTLVVQDILHSHTVDTLDLVQQHTIAVADLLHGHTLDAAPLVQQHLLAIADLLHVQTLDSPFVSIEQLLVVQDMLHGHTLDNVTIGVYIKIKPPPPEVELGHPRVNTHIDHPEGFMVDVPVNAFNTHSTAPTIEFRDRNIDAPHLAISL